MNNEQSNSNQVITAKTLVSLSGGKVNPNQAASFLKAASLIGFGGIQKSGLRPRKGLKGRSEIEYSIPAEAYQEIANN